MRGYIVYPTYRVEEDKPVVHLYGRLENGESFLAKQDFEPYFFILKSDLDRARNVCNFETIDTTLTDFNNRQVTMIKTKLPSEVANLRKTLEKEGIVCYEADIRFAYRFLIDKQILLAIEIEGEFEKGEHVDRIYKNARLSPTKPYNINLKVLSIDIETDANAEKVLSVALFSQEYEEVLIVSDKEIKNAASFKSEKEMLVGFVERIKRLDPDILVGWNFINFDLAVLQRRFSYYKLPFLIGRGEVPCKIKVESDFFRQSHADIFGRAALDGIDMLKAFFFSLDDFRLDTAAKVLIGKEKIDIGGREQIEFLFKNEPEKLVEYNLNDARLVYEILEKKGIFNLAVEKSLLTGLPLERLRASIAALDMLYLREARARGLVCPSAKFGESEERVKGAYVMEPKFGIYRNILVLDFKSLYPSIIRTFNIDPWTYARKGKIVAPNKASFFEVEGILPGIIEKLYKEREKAKSEKNQIKSLAIKIIMNSFYGVLANPTCRFYNLEMANAITSWAREIVQETAHRIRSLGYEVIYGDTDSVFVVSNARTIEEARSVGEKIQKDIDEYFQKKVSSLFGRDSFLDLEFDKLYRVFLLPKIRGQEYGAKKRYAGLIVKNGDEQIDIVGLEFVRRDWTELAKTFQVELLERVFYEKEIDTYIKQFVKKLKEGRLDSLLVYRKAIRKDLENYTKTTPPHVKAARQLAALESNIIEYYQTKAGPEPVKMLRHHIDYDHYIEKQLKPIADSILVFFGKKFDDIIGNGNRTLSEF